MKKGKKLALAAAVIALLTLVFTMPATGQAPQERAAERTEEEQAEQAAENRPRAAAGCQVIQTMRFSRCGHSVTRRVAAPKEIVGADFQAAQGYYDLWRLDAFSPDQIEMSREIALFCPMHWVLACSEAGEIVLTQNRYGDGMAIEKTYPGIALDSFDANTRESLRQGMGFDSQEEAEAFLSAH